MNEIKDILKALFSTFLFYVVLCWNNDDSMVPLVLVSMFYGLYAFFKLNRIK